MPRLYAHIGVHKTGSSAIQSALRESSRELRQEGIRYIPRTGFFGQRVDLRSPLRDEVLLDAGRGLRQLVAEDAGIGTWVVSYEALAGELRDGYASSGERARRLSVMTEGFDVEVLAYVRRQDVFVESAYAQLVHEGESLSFDDYLLTLPPNAFSWGDLLDSYAEHFGKDSISVSVYDRERLADAGGLIADFAGLLGSEKLASAANVAVNQSCTRDALEIARLCNRSLDAAENRRLRRLLQGASNRQPHESENLFRSGERARFLDTYAESNAYVAQQYVDGERRELFPPPSARELETEDYPGLTAEGVARTLALSMLSVDEAEAPEPSRVSSGRRLVVAISRRIRRYPRLWSVVHRLWRFRRPRSRP